jgi:hypothetical protein
MFCPNCGAQNRAGVSHCGECHRQLPSLSTSTSAPAAAPAEPPRILRRPGPLAPPSVELPHKGAPMPAPLPAPNITAPPGPMPSPFADATVPVPVVAPQRSAAPVATTTASTSTPSTSTPALAPPAAPRPSSTHVQVAPTVPEGTLPSLPRPTAPPRPAVATTSPAPLVTQPAAAVPPAPVSPRAAPSVAPVAQPEPFVDATAPLRPAIAPPALTAPPPTNATPVPHTAPPATPTAPPAPAPPAAVPPAAVPPASSSSTSTATATRPPASPAAPARSPLPAPRPRTAVGTAASSPAGEPSDARVIELVSPLRQWAAAVVDGCLGGALVLGAARGALALTDIRPTTQGIVDALHATGPLALLPLVGAIAVALLFFFALPVVLRASPGQRALRLQLVDKRGARAGFARLVLRAVLAAGSTLCFFAGPLWGLIVDSDRRSLADRLSGTFVARP